MTRKQRSRHPRRRGVMVGPAATGAVTGMLVFLVAGGAAAPVAYVANEGSDSVTPIDLATNTALAPIPVGTEPTGVAVTPDGATTYVTNTGSNDVTPIDVASMSALPRILVGGEPVRIAITPNGKTAYVANVLTQNLSRVEVASNTLTAPPIPVGAEPSGIAITPDGTTAYVTNFSSDDITPVDIASNTSGTPIPAAGNPTGIAVTPDGTTAYFAAASADTVTPIDVSTNTTGAPIAVGENPTGIAITPDGKTAYVANTESDTVTPIDLATGTAGAPIAVGRLPVEIAIAPDGTTAYVVLQNTRLSPGPNPPPGLVKRIDVATNTIVGNPITVGKLPNGIAITPEPAPPPTPPAPPQPLPLASEPAPTSGSPVCNPIRERTPGEGGVIRYTRQALKFQQNIDSAGIRRLNAINAWIDAGIVPTDLCAGAFGPDAFQAGMSFAGGAPHDASPPTPRKVEIAGKKPTGGTITRSTQQLEINERIGRAFRARATATLERLSTLTGGNLAANANLAGRAVWPGLTTSGPQPAPVDGAATELSIGPLPRKIPIRPNAATVRAQQRRSQSSMMLANRALDTIERGLLPVNFTSRSMGSDRIS